MTEEEKNREEEAKKVDEFAITDRAGYKNLVAVLEYTKKTREMFRELEKENTIYKSQVMDLGEALKVLKSQYTTLLIKVHQNGPTG